MSDERRKQQSTDGLVPGEAHLSRLYEQTKAELPPANLDTTVLTAAKRAVEPAPRASRVYFLPPRKWVIPLSLAAALLVVIGVTEFLPGPQMGVGLVQRAPERTRAQKNQSEIMREEGVVADAEKRKKSDAPKPAAAPPAPERRDVQPSFLIPATPSAPAESEPSDALAAAKAVSPLAKERGISRLSETQGVLADLEQKSDGRVAALKDEHLSPEEWIKQINELRRAKKLTEADESLQKFKERYPAYPVEKFLEQPPTSSRR